MVVELVGGVCQRFGCRAGEVALFKKPRFAHFDQSQKEEAAEGGKDVGGRTGKRCKSARRSIDNT